LWTLPSFWPADCKTIRSFLGQKFLPACAPLSQFAKKK